MEMVATSPDRRGLSVGMSPAMAEDELVKITCRNTCPKCGKVDAVDMNIPDWMARTLPQETSALCDKCRAVKDREEMEAYRVRQMGRLLTEANVPPEFHTWNAELGNAKLARTIRDNRERSLFVCGENSCGKTRCAAYNLLLEVKAGKNCRFWRFSELAARYAVECRGDGDAQKWLKQQMRHDVVVIDDIAKKRITETAGEMLFDLLDWLYAGEITCRLWITANKNLADLAKCFQNADTGDAVISRIDRMADDYDNRMKIIHG